MFSVWTSLIALGSRPIMPKNLRGHLLLLRVTLHTRDREPVTITLQALSLVEKAELVQVHFTALHTMHEGPTEYVNARWL